VHGSAGRGSVRTEWVTDCGTAGAVVQRTLALRGEVRVTVRLRFRSVILHPW
jgi:hypothetical protein